MFISGNTTPQAIQNDINALELNPLWTSLNRRIAPEDGDLTVPPSWWFTRKERYWYRHPVTQGCAQKGGFAFPSCDEFPYFVTLQGRHGLLETETPHTETVELLQNTTQGSLLRKFYSTDGPGLHPWFGCDVTGHPRTDVTVVSSSRFLALPTEKLPTLAICNKPRSNP